MQFSPLAWGLVALLASTPIVIASRPLPLAIKTLAQFPLGSMLENLAIRPNGHILASRLDTPEVLLIDNTNATAPIVISSWNASEYRGCLGISETTTDKFYVILSAFVDSTFKKTSGVNSIFEIDMNDFAVSVEGKVTRNATVTKLVDITESDSLNGMTTLDNSTILVGDSYNGWVYKVNTLTSDYSVAINDTNMKAPSTATTTLGVNGLKIYRSSLYWTNSASGSMFNIPIDATGAATGSSSLVLSTIPGADDFAFKNNGHLFVALNSKNQLEMMTGSTVETVAGSLISAELAGPSAGRFGRNEWDAMTLYMTTTGGLNNPVNGTIVSGATISYVDTTGL